ncbi:hypothetical protein PCANC_08147 [Puccinia coronata f. sp. avenae]|uniref:Uncharacterized protein n=1 Tax=Puccinia coronata f. sp. avenae TaxID=200324 RepID=A0A2N5VLV3_9BASI|nr:hypothetical protein PCANC_08147 [Puccinia coronata f. sp. avenae]
MPCCDTQSHTSCVCPSLPTVATAKRASPVDSLDRGPRPQSSESRPKLGSNGLATRPAKPIQGPSHLLHIEDDSESAPGHRSPNCVEDTSRLLPQQRPPATFFSSSTL